MAGQTNNVHLDWLNNIFEFSLLEWEKRKKNLTSLIFLSELQTDYSSLNSGILYCVLIQMLSVKGSTLIITILFQVKDNQLIMFLKDISQVMLDYE